MGTDKRRNEGQAAVYKGHDATRDEIRQPVRSKRKQSTRHNHVALLNYLYADVIALFAIAGSRNSFEPLPPWALMGSAVLMEIPIAMILACRLLPFRANRLANIIAGGIVTLVNGFLTFVPPLAGWGRPPAFPEYLFFATIETVATSVIIWQAWTWSGVEAEVSAERIVLQGR